MSIRKYGRYWALYDDAGDLGGASTRRALPRSSGACSSFPLHRYHPPQPATNPAHGSRADAWGSIDAASGLPFHSNAYKISPRKVDIGSLIGSGALWLRCL